MVCAKDTVFDSNRNIFQAIWRSLRRRTIHRKCPSGAFIWAEGRWGVVEVSTVVGNMAAFPNCTRGYAVLWEGPGQQRKVKPSPCDWRRRAYFLLFPFRSENKLCVCVCVFMYKCAMCVRVRAHVWMCFHLYTAVYVSVCAECVHVFACVRVCMCMCVCCWLGYQMAWCVGRRVCYMLLNELPWNRILSILPANILSEP